jgi:hypothetical protein
MFFINAISAWKSEISVYWYAKVPNKQNVKDISISVLSVLMIFIFAMHKKLSDSQYLLLELAEDKITGSM